MKKLLILAGLMLATVVPQSALAADTQAPTVELKAWETTVYGDTLPADVIVSDDVGVTKVEYAIDDKVVRTETAPNFDVFIDLTGLVAETHNLKAKAYDAAGNVAITRPRNFSIDRIAPEVTVNGPVISNAEYPQFSFSSPSADFASAGCVVQDRGPDQEYFECSKDVPFASGRILPDGEWQAVVHVRDLVGNRTTVRHPFVIDRTPPELAFTAGPADRSTVKAANVRYEWTAGDANGAKQTCSVDGAAPADCESGIDLTLPDGRHTLEVTATDEAGNVSRLSRSVTVDTRGKGPDVPPPGGDNTAPVVNLESPKQKLKALRKGLRIRVTCSEACAGALVAKPAKPAKATRGIRFAGRVSLATAGTAAVRLMPNAKTKKRLKRLIRRKRPLRLVTTSRLADPSGNATTSILKTKTRP